MKAIVYDCRDQAHRPWGGVTLRLFDDAGQMILQGQVLGENPRGLCDAITGGLGCELEWVGPTERGVTAEQVAERAAGGPLGQAQAPQQLASSAGKAVAPGGWLF